MKYFLTLFLCASAAYAQINFYDYFLDKTLRLDFYHTGDSETEILSFDELLEEPYWGGSKINLIDTFRYGNYMFELYDEQTEEMIYSRGFSTLFQEWQTTAESKITKRSMSGSVIMPYPKNKAVAKILRRTWKGGWEEKLNYTIDPDSYFIKKDRRYVYDKFEVVNNGAPEDKVDLVFIPEGYTQEEMDKFKKDCEIYAQYLFDYEPFSSNKEKFNVWGIEAPSLDSGSDIPADTVWKNTLLNSHYYTFDSERYLMTYDYKKVRDVSSNAPCDQIYILVNSNKYGGGAIYNYYSLGVTGNNASKQVFVHEFGHGFVGLADEYVDPTTYEDFYNLGIEPWEANITTLVDFESKWKDLMNENTPVPTPTTDDYTETIGVFEGAGYVSEGVYRSSKESIMKAFNSNEFNPVSQRAIERIIKFYSK